MRQDERLARFVHEGAPIAPPFCNLDASGSHCEQKAVEPLTLLTIGTRSCAQHPTVHETRPNP